MASSSDDASPPDSAGATGRRDFMRKAAVVGSGAFVVPMTVTVDPADVQALTGPPPEPPGRPGGGTDGVSAFRCGVPVTEDRPNAVSMRTAQSAAEPSRGAGAGGQLGSGQVSPAPTGTALGGRFRRALRSLRTVRETRCLEARDVAA